MRTTKLFVSIRNWIWTKNQSGKIVAVLLLALVLGDRSFAQNVKKIGKVKDLQKTLADATKETQKTSEKKKVAIETSGKNYSALIKKRSEKNGDETYIGHIQGSKHSIVSFNFSKGKVDGKIINPDEKKSYRYKSDSNGNVLVEETDINKDICLGIARAGSSGVTAAALNLAASAPSAGSPVYSLQSYAGAPAVIKLDFDGEYVVNQYWNSGNPIDAQPQNFTEADINEIFSLVSEDFKPFNINVTTSEAVFQAAPVNKRMRCVFTSTSFGIAADGVAIIGSFPYNNDTPCWVFAPGARLAGESASHEIGHTFGLTHDDGVPSSRGYWSGNAIWAPIMGLVNDLQIGQWSKGEYNTAINLEDDVAVIANSTNGFGFRTDDAGNTLATAKLLGSAATGEIAANSTGVISQRTDVDVYYFNTTGGTATINVKSTSVQPNLNILLNLKNSDGSIIATSDPSNSTNASIAIRLGAGKFYLEVDGVGQGDPLTTGYSDYGSLGEYIISGDINDANTAPTITLLSSVSDVYSLAAPAIVPLQAMVSDIEGPVSKVEFYQDNVKMYEDIYYPSWVWNASNLPEGIYTFKAKVYDQGGMSTESNTITIRVDGTPPTVSISSPANNLELVEPATVNVIAMVNDVNGPIKLVEFYKDGVKLGEDGFYPTFNWPASNLPAGTYVFTAKAIDQAGLSSVSQPVTVVVKPVCVLNEASPAASQFVVRNLWSDQTSGSGVSNESGALKVVHRAWGQNELWVLETGKTFAVTSGKTYNIKFDFKNSAVAGISGIEAGFATGINQSNNGPVLSGNTISFPAGFSTTAFTTKSVNLTAAATGNVYLALKLNWASQPSALSMEYIKNLMVCAGSGIASRIEDAEADAIGNNVHFNAAISPNPSSSEFTAFVHKDVMNMYATDIHGITIYSHSNIAQGSSLSFGENLTAGIYFVNLIYIDGTSESFKLVRTE